MFMRYPKKESNRGEGMSDHIEYSTLKSHQVDSTSKQEYLRLIFNMSFVLVTLS